MEKTAIDETKLPEAMKMIDDANSLMLEKDCEDDNDAKMELEEMQDKLREFTGNIQLEIRDFFDYDAAMDLETAARMVLMASPQKEDLTDAQIKEVVVNILTHDEAEMDWWIKYLEINTGLPNLSDYIFYPDLVGLEGDSSLEEIADKIIEDKNNHVGTVFLG